MALSDTTIRQVHAWEALDSRGTPTVGATVRLAGGATGRAIVPAGASTGGHEARERRDGDPDRYAGRGVRAAVAAVTGTLAPLVVGMDATDRPAVDEVMERADPDPLLGTVGANAVLGVSLAVTLAAADAVREPLWRVLSGEDAPLLPLPMVNIVSGGAHAGGAAGGALDIQDVLVVPVGASSFAEAIEWVWRVRRAAAERMAWPALVADEGGLAGLAGELDRGPAGGPVGDPAGWPAGWSAGNEAALQLVTDAIGRAGLAPGSHVALALDIAANQLHDPDPDPDQAAYRLRRDRASLDAGELLELFAGWCRRYPIVSLEDVLAEDDWAGWQQATARLGSGRQLLGDDLFATNAARLARGVAERVGNAVLVKPNQAGTLTRAERVVRQAQAAGYATVVSARSGDTEDTWLADLAVGWRAGQVKVGSTTRSERTAKWNRLLEIESVAGPAARFAGPAALGGQPS